MTDALVPFLETTILPLLPIRNCFDQMHRLNEGMGAMALILFS